MVRAARAARRVGLPVVVVVAVARGPAALHVVRGRGGSGRRAVGLGERGGDGRLEGRMVAVVGRARCRRRTTRRA